MVKTSILIELGLGKQACMLEQQLKRNYYLNGGFYTGFDPKEYSKHDIESAFKSMGVNLSAVK